MTSCGPPPLRTIGISDFVELSEVDPAYYQRTYWLAPPETEPHAPTGCSWRPWRTAGKAGIGMVVMRNKQYLAAIRHRDGALAMSTMRFADEIVDRKQIDAIPGRTTTPDAKEVRLATQIIDSLARPWKPETHRDTYTEEVRKLIKAHEKGQDVVVEEAPAARIADVVDLMAALEASLEAAKSRKGRDKALSEASERLSEESDNEDGSKAGGRSGKAPTKKAASRRPAKKTTAGSAAKQRPASQRKSA